MKTVILGAGGTSINEGIKLGLWEYIKNYDIWSLNYFFKMMPYLPKRELFTDTYFFNSNSKILPLLANKGIEIHAKHHHHYTFIKELKTHYVTKRKDEYCGREALKKNILYIGRMGLVGFFGLSLAIAEQYDNIILLGYDFGTQKPNEHFTHFYQKNIQVLSTGVGNPLIYRKPNGDIKDEVVDFSVYLADTNKCHIWNVSPNSNIPYFTKIDYPELFRMIGAQEI